jgi:hypothetical protein
VPYFPRLRALALFLDAGQLSAPSVSSLPASENQHTTGNEASTPGVGHRLIFLHINLRPKSPGLHFNPELFLQLGEDLIQVKTGRLLPLWVVKERRQELADVRRLRA